MMWRTVIGAALAGLLAGVGPGCGSKKRRAVGGKPSQATKRASASPAAMRPVGRGGAAGARMSPGAASPGSDAGTRAAPTTWLVQPARHTAFPPIPEIWHIAGGRRTVIDRGGRARTDGKTRAPPAARRPRPMASLEAAKAEVARLGVRYAVPYGLWFGMTRQQVRAHFAVGEYGRNTCMPRPGDRDRPMPEHRRRPWDWLPLPYLGLPIHEAECKYDAAGKLASIELTLRTYYRPLARGRRMWARLAERLTGLTRTEPEKRTAKQTYYLTWKVGRVRIAARRYDDVDPGPGANHVSLTLRFSPRAGYQPPAAADRWHHVARWGNPALRRKAKRPFALGGLKIGMPLTRLPAPRRRVTHKLLRDNIAWIRLMGDEWNPDDGQHYPCQPRGSHALRQFSPSGICTFAKGKLVGISLWVTMTTQNPYDFKRELRQAYEALVILLGPATPDPKGALAEKVQHDSMPETAVVWRRAGHTVVLRAVRQGLGADISEHGIELSVSAN